MAHANLQTKYQTVYNELKAAMAEGQRLDDKMKDLLKQKPPRGDAVNSQLTALRQQQLPCYDRIQELATQLKEIVSNPDY